jgi:hypothetical protein
MQAEVNMIELTPDQVQALAQAGSPPIVIDPTTRKIYALVPTDAGSSAQETAGPRETPAPPRRHLVVRNHPWRKQLYIKGRNMTVRHLVGGVSAGADRQAIDSGHVETSTGRTGIKQSAP